MEKPFLSYEEFWRNVGIKRSKSSALSDVHMLEFDEMSYNSESETYSVDVRMKEEFKKGYMVNPYLVEHDLIFLDTIHLVHWSDWLDIGVVTKRYPGLKNQFFFSTYMEFRFNEPTFLNQPMPFKIKILYENIRNNKSTLTFLNEVGNWAYLISEFVVVKSQFEILEHYYKKHKKQ